MLFLLSIMMEKLNLPTFNYKLQTEDKKTKIFDALRKKYLVLTPEEWVRQHIIHFLIHHKGYPQGLIALEKGLKLNQLNKRTDILVYSKSGKPILMVECKSAKVKITQAVFDQIASYNLHYKLPYLLVSNGLEHYCAKINFKKSNFNFLNELPAYEDLHF